MLARRGHAEQALERTDLLAVVARHKALFFRSGWARYDEAKPGSLRLIPAEARLADLIADYARMAPMFFGEPPSFRELLADIQQLERRINEGGA